MENSIDESHEHEVDVKSPAPDSQLRYFEHHPITQVDLLNKSLEFKQPNKLETYLRNVKPFESIESPSAE